MSRPTHTCHRGIFFEVNESTGQQVNKSTSWLSDKSEKSDRSEKSDEGGQHHNVGTYLWHVSMQTTMYQRVVHRPKAKALKNHKMAIVQTIL